ncbi:MAG: transposase zinc-binding domain-containing protein, partial [Candidatus Hydrogenedentota bacterium]
MIICLRRFPLAFRLPLFSARRKAQRRQSGFCRGAHAVRGGHRLAGFQSAASSTSRDRGGVLAAVRLGKGFPSYGRRTWRDVPPVRLGKGFPSYGGRSGSPGSSAAMGEHEWRCDACGQTYVYFNSRNRHCPACREA